MEDLFPLFSAFLVLTVCAVCYCRNRHHRQQNREVDYVLIPSVAPVTQMIAVPKPSAPPMPSMQEEETDPIV